MHRISDIDVDVYYGDTFQCGGVGDEASDLLGMARVKWLTRDSAVSHLAAKGEVDMDVPHRFVAEIMAQHF